MDTPNQSLITNPEDQNEKVVNIFVSSKAVLQNEILTTGLVGSLATLGFFEYFAGKQKMVEN